MIRGSGFQASRGMRRRRIWWEVEEPKLYIVTRHRETHQLVCTHEISPNS